MSKTSFLYRVVLLIFCGITSFNAFGQKLPNVQQENLKAPDDIKVDGKIDEWGTNMQAYNKSTSVFYSMANSKDYLYIIVKATHPRIIEKIMAGGVTLTIKSDDKKSQTMPISVTYPNISAKDYSPIMYKVKDTESPFSQAIVSVNQKFSASSKEIHVTGIPSLSDEYISVYNQLGIKADAKLDTSRAYTCEFAISLKYVESVCSKSGSFSYNIKLNGLQAKKMGVQINGKDVDPNSPQVAQMLAAASSNSQLASISTSAGGSVVRSTGNPLQELVSPTDFSGKYRLIK